MNLITRGWCYLLLGTSWNTPRIRRGLQRSYRGTSYPEWVSDKAVFSESVASTAALLHIWVSVSSLGI